MYDAIDIANYIIYYCNEIKRKKITNLQLQKILYYVQAAHLIDRGEPIFSDDIEAWKYGPVIDEVYHEFKYYGDGPIKNISPNIFICEEDEYRPELIIQEDEQLIIEEVVDNLIEIHGFSLIRRTHEELPWIQAYGRDDIIDIKSMITYFNNHRGRIYGME